MTPSLVLFRNGRKFMWDGQVYGSHEEASKAEERYRQDQFEVYVTDADGHFCVYTRRVASQVAAVQ